MTASRRVPGTADIGKGKTKRCTSTGSMTIFRPSGALDGMHSTANHCHALSRDNTALRSTA
jgi:hypothetical protein